MPPLSPVRFICKGSHGHAGLTAVTFATANDLARHIRQARHIVPVPMHPDCASGIRHPFQSGTPGQGHSRESRKACECACHEWGIRT